MRVSESGLWSPCLTESH